MASEALKKAMDELAASGDAPELADLPPSKLGTRDHWNEASRLLHRRTGLAQTLTGTMAHCRFGEDSAQDMVDWAEEHFPLHDGRILDVGTGNGQLLFAFSSAGYTSLTGLDYSPLSIELANNILTARTSANDNDLASPPPRFFTADILNVAEGKEVEGVTGERWDLITDKGTYDAVCLSDEVRSGKGLRELYVNSVAKLLPKGGLFLITSCNWTQAELEKAFVSESTGLVVHSNIPRASFEFGGSTGSSITTVAFEKR
ncbi:methyltransferase like 10 [Rhodotorula toruloides]|uniref:Protein-lysine N-methyltransferase EFM4 n=1 Tax=Rhodotorula toruloides TaxID=5286 RepID=A0A511KFU9_RHOTO|nr:methyltransferase like 10 [Rhodotorula toruloides]